MVSAKEYVNFRQKETATRKLLCHIQGGQIPFPSVAGDIVAWNSRKESASAITSNNNHPAGDFYEGWKISLWVWIRSFLHAVFAILQDFSNAALNRLILQLENLIWLDLNRCPIVLEYAWFVRIKLTHLTRVAYRDDAAPKSILVGEVITAQDDPRLHPACSMLIEPDTNLLRVMLLTIA